jgi:hypothetical protein
MAWIKLETSVSRHRKFLNAGPAASWLWVCGLAYCQEGLTDGFIPFQAIRHLGVRAPNGLITKLVRAGLWEQTEGGWNVHDYLLHHKPAAEVLGLSHERRENGAKGGRVSGEKRRFTDKLPETPKQVAEANPKQVASTDTKQTANPDQITQNSTDQITQITARPQSIVARRNLNAAWEGPRGLYVLQKQHTQFVASRNGNEAQVFEFYQTVAEAWGYGALKDANIDPDMPKFWNARYAEHWPPQKPAAVGGRYANWTPKATGTDGAK